MLKISQIENEPGTVKIDRNGNSFTRAARFFADSYKDRVIIVSLVTGLRKFDSHFSELYINGSLESSAEEAVVKLNEFIGLGFNMGGASPLSPLIVYAENTPPDSFGELGQFCLAKDGIFEKKLYDAKYFELVVKDREENIKSTPHSGIWDLAGTFVEAYYESYGEKPYYKHRTSGLYLYFWHDTSCWYITPVAPNTGQPYTGQAGSNDYYGYGPTPPVYDWYFNDGSIASWDDTLHWAWTELLDHEGWLPFSNVMENNGKTFGSGGQLALASDIKIKGVLPNYGLNLSGSNIYIQRDSNSGNATALSSGGLYTAANKTGRITATVTGSSYSASIDTYGYFELNINADCTINASGGVRSGYGKTLYFKLTPNSTGRKVGFGTWGTNGIKWENELSPFFSGLNPVSVELTTYDGATWYGKHSKSYIEEVPVPIHMFQPVPGGSNGCYGASFLDPRTGDLWITTRFNSGSAKYRYDSVTKKMVAVSPSIAGTSGAFVIDKINPNDVYLSVWKQGASYAPGAGIFKFNTDGTLTATNVTTDSWGTGGCADDGTLIFLIQSASQGARPAEPYPFGNAVKLNRVTGEFETVAMANINALNNNNINWLRLHKGNTFIAGGYDAIGIRVYNPATNTFERSTNDTSSSSNNRGYTHCNDVDGSAWYFTVGTSGDWKLCLCRYNDNNTVSKFNFSDGLYHRILQILPCNGDIYCTPVNDGDNASLDIYNTKWIWKFDRALEQIIPAVSFEDDPDADYISKVYVYDTPDSMGWYCIYVLYNNGSGDRIYRSKFDSSGAKEFLFQLNNVSTFGKYSDGGYSNTPSNAQRIYNTFGFFMAFSTDNVMPWFFYPNMVPDTICTYYVRKFGKWVPMLEDGTIVDNT